MAAVEMWAKLFYSLTLPLTIFKSHKEDEWASREFYFFTFMVHSLVKLPPGS